MEVLFGDGGPAGLLNSSSFNSLQTSFTVVEPIMHAFSSLLLLGTCVFQSVLGRPDATRVRREGEILKRSVDSFIAQESPIALSRLLCNIGSTGCYAAGASPGIVVASPSRNNPDCKFMCSVSRGNSKLTGFETGTPGLVIVRSSSRPSRISSSMATMPGFRRKSRTTLLLRPSSKVSPTLRARSMMELVLVRQSIWSTWLRIRVAGVVLSVMDLLSVPLP